MQVAVIIPAAGSSTRFNQHGSEAPRNKLDEDLGGRPVLQRTVELFNTRADVGTIIVAGPHDEGAMAEFRLRHADKLAILGVSIVRGGAAHRWETVSAALEHVPDSATHIAVHDGARPGTSPELIERVFEAAERHPAVIPALRVADTLKRVEEVELDAPPDPLAAILGPEGGAGPESGRTVIETIDRSGLVAVQTPQIFERDVLLRAYAQDDKSSTDDAALVERLGVPVLVVEGELRNLKITTPSDVEAIRRLLNLRAPAQRATHKRF